METINQAFARLNREGHPCIYFGNHGDWVQAYSVTRDSEVLDRANFASIEQILRGIDSENVEIERATHWACGWVDMLIINPENSALVEALQEINDALSNYPVVDDDLYSEMEYSEIFEYWESLTVKERMDYCRNAGLSIFAARRNEMPYDPTGALFDMLRG